MAGCNSAWWQNFLNNPMAQVQTFEQGVQVALNAAQSAWAFILPLIPASAQAQATTQYNNAVSAVNHALQVLNDGVAAAVAAKQATFDATQFMQAVSDAVAQIIAIIDQYKSSATPAPVAGKMAAPTAPVIPGYADLLAAYALRTRFGLK
jgi:hypothetical protein